MSEADIIQATPSLQTVTTLAADLRTLGIKAGETLLVHSSLKALGWVCGGAVAVIEALESVLGPTGTLMMPAHTSWNSEPSHWQNPPAPPNWWPQIRAEMPAWQADTAPTLGMGMIPETYRKRAGVLRSQHPQVSFIARGPQAKTLLNQHQLSPAFGENSPLARLSQLSGKVLLLGVNHGSNTSLHLAELRAEHLQKRTKSEGSAIFEYGERRWIKFEDLDYDSDDFVDLGNDFVASKPKSLILGQVGQAKCQVFDQNELLVFADDWLKHHR